MSETKVDETKPSETKPKKMVKRSVAIALGIVCIILVVVGAVGAVVYVIPMMNDKDNTISSLNLQISQSNANNTNLQTWLEGNITSYNSQISDLQNKIASLNSTYNGYANDHSYTNEQYQNLLNQINQLQTWLEGNITAYNSLQSTYNDYVSYHGYTNEQYNQAQTNYQNEQNIYNSYVNDHHHTDEEYNSLQGIANLQDSTVWVNNQPIQQPPGEYTSWTESANYAGYVSVWVQTSSVGGTHVRVIYSAHGVNFNQEIVVNVGGTAVFPILPSTITVEVGNGNQNFQGGASETVTITYYY